MPIFVAILCALEIYEKSRLVRDSGALCAIALQVQAWLLLGEVNCNFRQVSLSSYSLNHSLDFPFQAQPTSSVLRLHLKTCPMPSRQRTRARGDLRKL